MDEQRFDTGQTLVRMVADKDLGEIIFDLAEVALDHNLAEGVLKDVPIVGTLVSLVRTGQSISGFLFLKKLTRFLSNVNSVSLEERKKLLENYPNSSEEQRVLGENLLLALERLDDVKKPAILARFFAAFIESKINYLTFTRLARALEKFNMELLPCLQSFYKVAEPASEIPEEIIHELSLAGLVTVALKGSGTLGGSARYRSSELGDTFLLLGFTD